MNIVGFDPGNSGAVSWIVSPEHRHAAERDLHAETRVLDLTFERGMETFARKFEDLTESDLYRLVLDIKTSLTRYGEPLFAYLESVNAFPGQGVSTSFVFGRNYGFLRGVITASNIPFETVTAQKWRKALGCMGPPRSTGQRGTHADKKITKSAAQRLFPSLNITHAIADSLLIAEYGRRLRAGELK